MICPVCKRDLAPTLSICLTCGAMMNDTVREELQTKVAPASDSGRLVSRSSVEQPAAVPTPVSVPSPISQRVGKPDLPLATSNAAARALPVVRSSAPDEIKAETGGLRSKKTSPTLVEFQSKNTMIPDWRLQLQNTVRQRAVPATRASSNESVATPQAQLVSSGAAGAKNQAAATGVAADHSNPRVANALKRIEQSRQAFLEAPKPQSIRATPRTAAGRNFPFNVIERGPAAPAPARPAEPILAGAKPRLVSSLRIEKKGLDTNKLPPLEPQAVSANELEENIAAAKIVRNGMAGRDRIEIKHGSAEVEMYAEIPEVEADEIDDLAPFSMRFGAGLFDAIIGLFAAGILLSPVVLSAGEWMSFSGILTFVAGFAIVMFIYLTAAIGFVGRTFGMRLFSLEMIDAEENAYPTLHQAAVSSSVYLLSIAAGGLGFLPMLFNEEKRAAHDILSGTILIREL